MKELIKKWFNEWIDIEYSSTSAELYKRYGAVDKRMKAEEIAFRDGAERMNQWWAERWLKYISYIDFGEGQIDLEGHDELVKELDAAAKGVK